VVLAVFTCHVKNPRRNVITVLTWNAYNRSNGMAASRSSKNQPRI